MQRYELLSYKYVQGAKEIIGEFDGDIIDSYSTYPNRPYARTSAILQCLELLVLRHLEFDARPEHVERSLRSGTQIVLDYFFGDWMEGEFAAYRDPRRAQLNPRREWLKWLEPFQSGLLFGFLAENESIVQRLSSWIEESLPYDSTTRDLLKEDNYFYILLGYFLSGRAPARGPELEAAIEKGRGKRAKLLLECLRPLRVGDAAQFGEVLRQYLKRYLRAELKDRYVYDYISIEGSILWHTARTRGLERPSLAEKESALIITRESLGLA